jgi:hypothetical protein
MRHYDHHHDTVAQVRNCTATPGTTITRATPVAQDKPFEREASDKQLAFIKKLMAEREVTTQDVTFVTANISGTQLSMRQARTIIDLLLAKPLKTVVTHVAPSPSSPQAYAVPVGHYAIQMEGQDKPHFYRVRHGRKAGILFVAEQASDAFYSLRDQYAYRRAVVAAIAKDPAAAGLAYAKEIGRCYRCRRVLTDHENPYFAMGLGPECGKK